MKLRLLIGCFLFVLAFVKCKTSSTENTNKLNTTNTLSKIKIDEANLLNNLKILASDSLEGRGFTKAGNYKAQELIANEFKRLQLASLTDSSFVQKFSYTYKGKRRQRMFPVAGKKKDAENVPDTTVIGGNVLSYIKGKSNKIIVITGHLDHLGIKNGKIFNGADDNASGAAALITIAEYFKNKTLNHSLVFAAVDAEEVGSLGADYLVKNFPLSIKNVVLNINMDMIAHNDKNELYASGLYHYPKLKEPLSKINSSINLLSGHDNPNDKTKDDWTFSSDHRIFYRAKIPHIYFGVEDHEDYHKETDTFDKINKDFYINAVKLIINAIENYDTSLK